MIVSGKLRAQRAKSMKFKDGYMISSGQPVRDYIDSAVRHVLLRQVCLQWSYKKQVLTRCVLLLYADVIVVFLFGSGCSGYQS